ncbi:MAG TPA: alpha-hydroxy acid oxidase [Jatrophihabitantaceae bacterium]|nr:alpha-hydroxy acid oxidase [Jatrophihabitantaceae bacterium]
MDLAALEASARQLLPEATYNYLAGGADDELTLADNVAAWSRYQLRPHVLRDVSTVDLSTSLLGTLMASPIHVAPTAYHRLLHAEGEVATARAAAAAGSVFTLSTVSTVSIEDVANAVPEGRHWFQLYVHSDRDLTVWLVQRAEAAGFSALVLTVDVPVLGQRRRDGATGFSLPPGVEPANLVGHPGGQAATSSLVNFAATAFDPSLTMDAIGWLREHTRLPIVVKGVLRGDDAAACVAAGASAVQVSNHGGRQLDGVLATADALADVAAAVGDRAEVYVDGGIRRGTDVLRALALGARSVFVGRAVLWGLAVNGAEGARAVLSGLAAETARAFQLAGVRSCAETGSDLLA